MVFRMDMKKVKKVLDLELFQRNKKRKNHSIRLKINHCRRQVNRCRKVNQ